MQLWDLVTGQRVTLEQIGSNASDLPDRPEYWLQEQVPGFWSPDERRVLLNAQRWEGAPIAGVLASWDGSVEPILLEGHNSAWPVGWLDDERIGWLSEDDDGRRRLSDGRAPQCGEGGEHHLGRGCSAADWRSLHHRQSQ